MNRGAKNGNNRSFSNSGQRQQYNKSGQKNYNFQQKNNSRQHGSNSNFEYNNQRGSQECRPDMEDRNLQRNQNSEGGSSQNHDKNSYVQQSSTSSNFQKHPQISSDSQRNNYPSEKIESVHQGEPQDKHQNLYNKDCPTVTLVENNISNNLVNAQYSVINEVPREPPFVSASSEIHISDLKSIKIIGPNEKFDELFISMLNTHPDGDKLLAELTDCSNVEIEFQPNKTLSANAPEFQMPKDHLNEPVSEVSNVQHSCTSDIDAMHEPCTSDVDAIQEPCANYADTVKDLHTNTTNTENSDWDKENEGAVGGISDADWNTVGGMSDKNDWVQEDEGAVDSVSDKSSGWHNDHWKKKGPTYSDKDWSEEVEDEENKNSSDNRPFMDRKPKYDSQKRNNRNKEGNSDKAKMKIKEVSGDLFEAPKDNSLAHCVGADMKMGSGIAVTFKREFKNEANLLDQRKRVGQVAILDEKDRFIYYLVTKKHSTGKPRSDDLEKSLIEMKNHCTENGVKKLSMPRIGCGLDRLEWSVVRQMIEDIFSDVDIFITVYNLNTNWTYHESSLSSDESSDVSSSKKKNVKNKKKAQKKNKNDKKCKNKKRK